MGRNGGRSGAGKRALADGGGMQRRDACPGEQDI